MYRIGLVILAILIVALPVAFAEESETIQQANEFIIIYNQTHNGTLQFECLTGNEYTKC